MGNFNYARSKATADRLIKRFGKTTTTQLIPPPTKSGDPFNPTMSDGTPLNVNAVVLDYTTKEIDGSRILSGDRKVYVAIGNTDVQVTPEWRIKIKMKGDASAKEYAIIGPVKPLEPGDVTLLWELQVRA